METAQYNITNNRLFFWPEEGTKLPEAEYQAVKKLGFQWWPRGCFTTIWTPQAEDWISARGIEIMADDEPDDVESRVNRYSGYADKAEAEAGYAARRAASATTDRRFEHASRAAERETERAAYWQHRIAGAVARLKQRDSYTTIQNRIKKLEADKRRHQKEVDLERKKIALWEQVTDYASAKSAANVAWGCTVGGHSLYTLLERKEIEWQEAQAKAIAAYKSGIGYYLRWIEHEDMRLEYERAIAVDLHGEKILEKQPRRVSQAPDDGLKKGVKVQVHRWLGGKDVEWTAPIISLGPKSFKVALPPEFQNNYRKDEQFPRNIRYYKIVE